jgi:hypothetical protein
VVLDRGERGENRVSHLSSSTFPRGRLKYDDCCFAFGLGIPDAAGEDRLDFEPEGEI